VLKPAWSASASAFAVFLDRKVANFHLAKVDNSVHLLLCGGVSASAFSCVSFAAAFPQPEASADSFAENVEAAQIPSTGQTDATT
jgi:hypothetical protein